MSDETEDTKKQPATGGTSGSDHPFSKEHIDGLSDLLTDPEVPDEDTGTYKLPISKD
jgi:hypothetical protein